MNGCLQIWYIFSFLICWSIGNQHFRTVVLSYFEMLLEQIFMFDCYIIRIDCFLEQIWKIHYFDKMENMSKSRWIQCFSLRKYGPFIHKLEPELLWNFDILANMIFRFIWSVWILGVYGKSILGVIPRTPQPLRNTDSHLCIKTQCSSSLSGWSARMFNVFGNELELVRTLT